MTRRGIFKTTDSGKNDYFNRCIPYINTHQLRLKADASKVAVLLPALADWNSTYAAAINKATTTKPLRDHKNDLAKSITAKLKEIYNDIPQSVLTDADRNTLNLKKRSTRHSPRPQISETPFVKISTSDGGLIKFICRTNSDASRAGKHPNADSIEVKYCIGSEAPKSMADCKEVQISTKALFTLDAGSANAGKKFYVFVRWRINSNPAKSSPWTKMMNTTITD